MSYGYGGGNGYGNNNSFNGGGPPPQNYPPPQHYNNNYPPAPSHYSSHYGPPPPSLGGYSNSRGPYDDPYPPPMMPPHQQHYPDPHQQHSPFPPHPDEFRAPPEVALDPNAFRRFFAYHLTTLTYNSKPAITNLTLFAHQHLLRMSTVVASCLEDHLRTCPPANRLPALYLLDSISKNIGPPYIALFTRFIERTFLSAYHVVDSQTKVKMEELLGTWRTGGSDGGELFRGPEEGRLGRVQRGIETSLFGPNGRGGGIGGGGRPRETNESYMAGMQQLPSVATRDERSGVLLDVRKLLQLRQEQSLLHPEDAVNTSQIMALQKLESLVTDTQLTSDQVSQIRLQLAALAPREPLPPPPAPEFDLGLLAQLKELTANGDLRGLLGNQNSVVAEVKVESEVDGKGKGKENAVVPEDRAAKEYNEALLRLDLESTISTADLLKSRPLAPSFLYNRFPKQCQQCGLRFLDSEMGQRSMAKHMDWHFTHKRRIREGAGRPQGRSWLALEEDWFKSDEVDLTYDNIDPNSSFGSVRPSAAAVGAAAAAVDEAQLRLRKVPVPTDPAKVGKPCPICQEHFKSELSEEDEDWVLWNAEEVDGVIYHATCFAQAAASKITNQRLRIDESNRPSRESTPTVLGESKLGGSAMKRKLEWDEFGEDEDEDSKLGIKRPKGEDEI